MRPKTAARVYAGAALTALTLGRADQSFLDAGWVAALLRRAPSRSRRRLALLVLNLSPHYFYREPADAGLSHADFTEREFERNRTTRERLGELLLLPYLKAHHVVLDYGCGPGFLARYVAGVARTVYGVDISRGVLECASIINSAPNITFVHSDDMAAIGDSTVDLAYSVAVAQHLTDAALARAFDALGRKLKPGGRFLLHAVLDAKGWRTEEEWRRNVSLAGRLKLKYGLNCFTRSETHVRAMLQTAGFGSIVVIPMHTICPEPFDDVCTQHLVCATRV